MTSDYSVVTSDYLVMTSEYLVVTNDPFVLTYDCVVVTRYYEVWKCALLYCVCFVLALVLVDGLMG